jgi:peptidoglycan hydrolase CwlO-like protein
LVSALTKVFIVLTTVLSITVSSLFVAAAARWQNMRELVDGYRTARNAAVTQRMAMQSRMQVELAIRTDQIAEVTRALQDAQQKIQDLTDQEATLKADLAEAKQQALAYDAARTKLREMLSVVTNERQSIQMHNQELLGQNTDLQTRNTRLNERALELTARVATLTDEVRNLKEKNYAYEQQLASAQRRGAAGPAAPEKVAGAAEAVQPRVAATSIGTIRSIDGKYAQFDLGETDGVVPGATWTITRGGNFVGELIVDSVRPKSAGGRLVLVSDGRTAQVGDLVENLPQ